VIRRLRQELGYSAVELIMVMAILGLVVGGITSAFVSGSKAQVDLSRRFEGQQNARLALASLRRSIHTACSASVPQTGRLYLYAFDQIKDQKPLCETNPNDVWCTYASLNNSARYRLFEVTGTNVSCPGTAPTNIFKADFLTTNALFTVNAPLTGQRASVSVTLPVNTNRASSATTLVDRYELRDTIVVRNGPTGA
jgi:type II secretory pathway pseudopilin PulG